MKSRQVAGVRHALGLTALLTMSGSASVALAQTEVFPMGDGRVSVSMDG